MDALIIEALAHLGTHLRGFDELHDATPLLTSSVESSFYQN